MLYLTVALAAEAAPVISAFDLKLESQHDAFPVYTSDSIKLIVSTPGKLAAAAAVHYLVSRDRRMHSPHWLNIGTAGHASFPVGLPLLIHSVKDAETGKVWALKPFSGICSTEGITSVTLPEQIFAQACLYDMEASGFVAAASLFSNIEQIQCLKIVSDNRDHPARRLSGDFLKQLIQEKMDVIERVIKTALQWAA